MEKKITDLLDCIQDDTVQLHTEDVTSIERIKEITMKKIRENSAPHKRTVKLSTILIAAAITVSLLTGTAFAIYYFSLRDLVIPEIRTVTPSQDTSSQVTGSQDIFFQDADAQDTGFQNCEFQDISLQGFVGSNEYEAAIEWLAFRENYDKDRAILNEIGNRDTGLGIAYDIYGAYTQEMADKLDEIAGKYGLSLHGEPINTPVDDTVDEFVELVAYGNFLGDSNTAAYPGLVYEGGTFFFEGYIADYEPEYSLSVDFDFRLIEYGSDLEHTLLTFGPEYYFEDGVLYILVPYGGSDKDAVVLDRSSEELTVAPYDGDVSIDDLRKSILDDSQVGFQFRYCRKGSLDDVIVGIGNIEEHTTWSYKTACGIAVILSQSPYQNLVIADLSGAFVTINITDGRMRFTASELEAFADTIDFTLLK